MFWVRVSKSARCVGKANRKYLDEKSAKYNLQPVAIGLFGGVYNYNKVPKNP